VRYQISIEIDGKPLIDERVASILEAIKERGSLLAASKAGHTLFEGLGGDL
jgi:molybdenum-dependent DNA-binding transcriptional regulator ModE